MRSNADYNGINFNFMSALVSSYLLNIREKGLLTIVAFKISNNLRKNGPVWSFTIDDFVDLTGLSKKTIKNLILGLTEKEILIILEEGKKGRKTKYTLDFKWFENLDRQIIQYMKEERMWEPLFSNNLSAKDIKSIGNRFNMTEDQVKNKLKKYKNNNG